MLSKVLHKLPSPGPSSIKLKFFGFCWLSQKATVQIAIISPNKIDTSGEVMKSPETPNGFRVE